MVCYIMYLTIYNIMVFAPASRRRQHVHSLMFDNSLTTMALYSRTQCNDTPAVDAPLPLHLSLLHAVHLSTVVFGFLVASNVTHLSSALPDLQPRSTPMSCVSSAADTRDISFFRHVPPPLLLGRHHAVISLSLSLFLVRPTLLKKAPSLRVPPPSPCLVTHFSRWR